jgi:hypothetical protein
MELVVREDMIEWTSLARAIVVEEEVRLDRPCSLACDYLCGCMIKLVNL